MFTVVSSYTSIKACISVLQWAPLYCSVANTASDIQLRIDDRGKILVSLLNVFVMKFKCTNEIVIQ